MEITDVNDSSGRITCQQEPSRNCTECISDLINLSHYRSPVCPPFIYAGSSILILLLKKCQGRSKYLTFHLLCQLQNSETINATFDAQKTAVNCSVYYVLTQSLLSHCANQSQVLTDLGTHACNVIDNDMRTFGLLWERIDIHDARLHWA